MNIKLELPNIKYKDSFLSAISEFILFKNKHGQSSKYAEMSDNMSDTDFAEYINKLQTDANTSDPKTGLSRNITYWLIDNDKYVGSIRLRPDLSKEQAEWYGHIGYDIRPTKRGMHYATKMLQMLLLECEKFGLTQVCIVCNSNNVSSRKIIDNARLTFGGKAAKTKEADNYGGWINTSKKS